jgi:hypothetical protein
MTIVCYKGGVMAVDSQASSGNIAEGAVNKMARNKAGDLMGCSGDAAWCHAMLRWFMAGEKGKRPHMAKAADNTHPGYALVVRAKDRTKVWSFSCDVDIPTFSLAIDPVSGCAIGSGFEVARGAMFAGADAVTAAIAACNLVSGCGGDIHYAGHGGAPMTRYAARHWRL